MPWKELSIVSQRLQFVSLAGGEGVNLSALCRRFGVSRKTAYRWLARDAGGEPMEDRSRRPHRCPRQTPPHIERLVVEARQAHPAWGGRKIARRLIDLGHAQVPSPSTVTAILHRHGLIDPRDSAKHTPFKRFEHDQPNALWQMDFKGHFPLADGRRCHPLTVLDDHSRYALVVAACADERRKTVEYQLTAAFERYGLPHRLLCDNGAPWGVSYAGPRGVSLTGLEVWLMRLGVRVTHGRPAHPQTQGKDERFHRTLNEELIRRQTLVDHDHAARQFERFVECYNYQRPHEALDMATPASRYRPSPRDMPRELPPLEYDEPHVRRVDTKGTMYFRGRRFRVSRALAGQPVGLRPATCDGVWRLVFAHRVIGELDTRTRHWSVRAVSARCAHSHGPDRPRKNV